jgi:hypothetical protein
MITEPEKTAEMLLRLAEFDADQGE